MSRTRGVVAWFVLVLATGAGLGTTGCTGTSEPTVTLPGGTGSGHNDPASAPRSTSSGGSEGTTSTRTSIDATRREVLDAYLGLQEAFEKAGEIPDPGYPDLSRYASGAALELLTTGLTSMRAEGLQNSGRTVFNPQVTQLSPAKAPTRARVQDCMDTSRTHLRKVSGAPYKDTPGGRRLAVATVERAGGTWKVTGLGIHDVGSCTG
jgi:hypothetical protein